MHKLKQSSLWNASRKTLRRSWLQSESKELRRTTWTEVLEDKLWSLLTWCPSWSRQGEANQTHRDWMLLISAIGVWWTKNVIYDMIFLIILGSIWTRLLAFARALRAWLHTGLCIEMQSSFQSSWLPCSFSSAFISQPSRVQNVAQWRHRWSNLQLQQCRWFYIFQGQKDGGQWLTLLELLCLWWWRLLLCFPISAKF